MIRKVNGCEDKLTMKKINMYFVLNENLSAQNFQSFTFNIVLSSEKKSFSNNVVMGITIPTKGRSLDVSVVVRASN